MYNIDLIEAFTTFASDGAHLLHMTFWISLDLWDIVIFDVEKRNVGIIHIDIYKSCDIFDDEDEEDLEEEDEEEEDEDEDEEEDEEDDEEEEGGGG